MTIKILKRGDIPVFQEPCGVCKSVLEVSARDAVLVSGLTAISPETLWKFDCPVCGQAVYHRIPNEETK